MFLSSNYVLANELVQKMGIHIANVSIMRKEFEHDDDYYSIRKMNNCSFVNTKARKLPNNIKAGISAHTFTDLTRLLPCTYVRSEFNVTEREWSNAGLILGKTKLAGKMFYVFDQEFADNVGSGVPFIMDENDTAECTAKKTIKGSIQLGRNKFFTWY